MSTVVLKVSYGKVTQSLVYEGQVFDLQYSTRDWDCFRVGLGLGLGLGLGFLAALLVPPVGRDYCRPR